MIKFTLCIPTMNRFDNFLKRNLPYFIQEPRIDQIVICDENGAKTIISNKHQKAWLPLE